MQQREASRRPKTMHEYRNETIQQRGRETNHHEPGDLQQPRMRHNAGEMARRVWICLEGKDKGCRYPNQRKDFAGQASHEAPDTSKKEERNASTDIEPVHRFSRLPRPYAALCPGLYAFCLKKATWKMVSPGKEVMALRSFDLRQVEVFYYVAKFRSFSKAAEALLLTQPTISGHIKTLEESLSLVLFDRLGREISLTRAGEVLYGYAKRLLSVKMATLQALQEIQGGLRGELSIGGSSIPGQYILPPMVGEFKRLYPAITVMLSIADTMQILDRVVHGELELGFVGAHIAHTHIVYHPFVDDELVLVASRDHPWASRSTVPLDALLTEAFIQRERGSGSRLVVEQTLKRHGVEPTSLQVTAEMGSTEAIKQGVRAGIGVAIISRLALADELQAGSLRAIAVEDVVFRRSFYSIRHKGRILSPLGQTFERFVHAMNTAPLGAQDPAYSARA